MALLREYARMIQVVPEVNLINEEFISEISGAVKELEEFCNKSHSCILLRERGGNRQLLAEHLKMVASWYIQDLTELLPFLKCLKGPPVSSDPCGVKNPLVASDIYLEKLSRISQQLGDSESKYGLYILEAEKIERLASGLYKSIGDFLMLPPEEQFKMRYEYIFSQHVTSGYVSEDEYEDGFEDEAENGAEAKFEDGFGDEHEDESGDAFRSASSKVNFDAAPDSLVPIEKIEDREEEAEGDDEDRVEKDTEVQDAPISPIGIKEEVLVKSVTSGECKKRKESESATDVHDGNSMQVRSLKSEEGEEDDKRKVGEDNEVTATPILQMSVRILIEDKKDEAEGDVDEGKVEKVTEVQDAPISPIGIKQEDVESSTSVEYKKRKQCESAADVHDENSMKVRSMSHEHGVEVGKPQKAGREKELNVTCVSLDKSGVANKDKPGSEGRRNVEQLLLDDRFLPLLVLRQLFADLKSHEILGRIDRNLMEGVLRYYAKDFPEGICTSFWREISILLTLNEEGAEEKVGKFEDGAEGKVYKFDSKHWKRHNYLKLSDDARAHRSKILNEKSAGRKLAKLRHFAENYSSWGIGYYKFAEFYWHANQKCHPIIEELGEEVCGLGARGAYVFDGFDLWGVVETLVSINSNGTFDTTELSSLSPIPYTPLTD